MVPSLKIPYIVNMGKYKHIDISSVVQISEWADLEDVLAGSRVKTTVSSPKLEDALGDDLYIFKHPKPRREAQIWSELIASFIAGDLLNWPVQSAKIAMRGDQIGNLLGYVYEDQVDTFFAGELLCKHVDVDFDPEQGRRHTWALIRKIHDEFFATTPEGEFVPELSKMYQEFWARTIAFDTLISNTDRHAENWAIVATSGKLLKMAPFFDNASSMGCEIDEVSLRRKWFDKTGKIVQSKVVKYSSSGCHHLREVNSRFEFEALSKAVIKDFPDMRSEFEGVAGLNLEPVERLLEDITLMEGIPEDARMSWQRMDQIMTLLHEGQARVRRSLEEK